MNRFTIPRVARRDATGGLVVVAVALLIAVVLSALAVASRAEAPTTGRTDMRAGHTTMIEQMRQDVTPGMIERMNEPEWRRMRAPGHLAEMEAHQRDTDRMLGRAP